MLAVGARVPVLVLGPLGWIIVVTTLGLVAMPWQLHRRFAAWSVPMATRNMPLLAISSGLGGAVLIVAALLGRGAN